MHTVLIVDDSKLARMAVAKALHSLRPEWAQVEAGNAAEARQRINESHADIVLLDFNMPGEDGLTLGAQLRQEHPEIRLAVISANPQRRVTDGARELGATYLNKPLSHTALGAFLSTVS